MINKNALEPDDTMDELLDCWLENHNEFVRKCNPDSCDVSSRYLDSNTTCADGAFDAYSLIPEGTGYYHYMGGLTTPPCSQIVRWNLMDTTVKVTLLQWTKLANLILGFGGSVGDDGTCHLEHTVASKTGSTSRVPRPINGRALTHSCNAFISSRMSAKRNHWQSWPLCSKISRALFSFWPIYNIVCWSLRGVLAWHVLVCCPLSFYLYVGRHFSFRLRCFHWFFKSQPWFRCAASLVVTNFLEQCITRRLQDRMEHNVDSI